MKNRNKKILISAILLSLFSITFIVSYSFYEFEDKTNEVTITSGIINMTLSDDTALNLTGEFPMEYDDVLELENNDDSTDDHLMHFKLTADNDSTNTFYYSIQIIEGESIDSKVRLDSEYIKFDLFEKKSETDYYYLRNVKLSDYLNTNIIVSEINGSSTLNKTFYIRAWISDKLVVGNSTNSVISSIDFANSYANLYINVDCNSKEKKSNFSYINKASKRNTTTSIYSTSQVKNSISEFTSLRSGINYKNNFVRATMGNDENNRNVTYFFANYKFFKDKLLSTTTVNFKKVSSSFIDDYFNNKIKANDLAPEYTETNGKFNDSDTSDTADYFDHTDYNFDGKRTIGYFEQIGLDTDSNPIYEYNIVSDGIIVFPEDASNMFNLTVNEYSTWSTTEVEFSSWGNYYYEEEDDHKLISYFQNLEYINFDNVYTGNTTDFGYIFQDLRKLKEIDLSKLDTHNGVRMTGLFTWCKSLTELDLSNFDLSRATDISWLFSGLNLTISEDGSVDDFNGTLQNLDVHRVTTLTNIFTNCPNIARLDLRSWHTGTLEFFSSTMPFTTSGTEGVNTVYGADESDNIQETYYVGAIMGQNYSIVVSERFCTLKYLDISNFDVSNITNFYCLFMDYVALETLKIDNWDTSNCTDFSFMFYQCLALENFDTSILSVTSKATNLAGMFYGCNNLETIDVSAWNTSNVTLMNSLFMDCNRVTNLDVTKWDTSNVTNMDSTFMGCSSLKNLNMIYLDFSKVTTIANMFTSCSNLERIIGDYFNFSSTLTNVDYCFSNCTKLETIPMFWYDTTLPSVSELYNVFYNCSSLKSLDLRGLINSNTKLFYDTFYGCTNLKYIYVNENYSYDNLTTNTGGSVFYNCLNLQSITGTRYSEMTNPGTLLYAKIGVAGDDPVYGYFSLMLNA